MSTSSFLSVPSQPSSAAKRTSGAHASVPTNGLLISPPMQTAGGSLYSVRGPLHAVLAVIDSHNWEARQLIALGVKCTPEEKDVRKCDAHIIVGIGADDLFVEHVDSALIVGLQQPDMCYAHMLAMSPSNVCIAVFDRAFKAIGVADKILDVITAHLFFPTGFQALVPTYKNMLLIGSAAPRVMVACKARNASSYVVLHTPVDQDDDASVCHALIQDTFLFVATRGLKQIACTNLEEIDVTLFQGTPPIWKFIQLPAGIEEMAPIDGAKNTILFTMSHEYHTRLMPMRVSLNEKADIVLHRIDACAQPARAIGTHHPPIVRVDADNYATIVERTPSGARVTRLAPATMSPVLRTFIDAIRCAQQSYAS